MKAAHNSFWKKMQKHCGGGSLQWQPWMQSFAGIFGFWAGSFDELDVLVWLTDLIICFLVIWIDLCIFWNIYACMPACANLAKYLCMFFVFPSYCLKTCIVWKCSKFHFVSGHKCWCCWCVISWSIQFTCGWKHLWFNVVLMFCWNTFFMFCIWFSSAIFYNIVCWNIFVYSIFATKWYFPTFSSIFSWFTLSKELQYTSTSTQQEN